MYKDRQGAIHKKEATPNRTLWCLYRTRAGRRLLSIMTEPGFSDFMRWLMTRRISCLWIDRFARKYHISLRDYIPERYKCYNDFFTRKIRPDRRPIENNENLLASPCDARASVFRISDRLVLDIKGSKYSVKSLIRDTDIAEEFADGWCMVLRLTVDDYHRYCYPDDGYKSDDFFIPGFLHTVAPVAEKFAKVYAENQRVYTVMDTDHFGRMVQMEIGAMSVGRIVNHDDEGAFKRGKEKGYFEFGGSTIVLLLKSESFIPDEDIVRNTADGYETRVRMGERIGCNEKFKG